MTLIGAAAFLAVLPLVSAPQSPPREAPARETPQAEQPEEARKKPEGWRFGFDPGPSLRLGDTVRLDFHLRLQLDATDSPYPRNDEDDDSGSAFDIGRRRIGVEGEIGRLVQFQVERELGSEEPWRDVFLNYRQFAAIRVQGGKFKLPFSLEENVSSAKLDFAYRSRATQLAPGRDLGVMIHGRPFTRLLRYEIGVFEHDGRNARPRTTERVFGGRTLVGRLTALPFAASKSDLADLRLAVAFAGSTLPEGFPALRGQTVLDSTFFRADVWVNGRRQRTGVEFRWRPGPFSIQSEYIRLADERRGESVEDTDLSPIVASGWYVSGTWAVTGERKADGLDRPRRPLLPGWGPGAIELAVRVEALRFGSGADDEPPATSTRANVIPGNALNGTTLGVNWHPSRWIRLQANLIRERLDDPARGPLPDSTVLWTSILRAQLAF
jgi:phosphate-selective porin OprO/OprP